MDQERTVSNKYTDFSQLPLILTPMDIKEILGISRSNAYALCHSKDFPAMRIGKLIRISKEEFIEWVKKVEYVSLEAVLWEKDEQIMKDALPNVRMESGWLGLK